MQTFQKEWKHSCNTNTLNQTTNVGRVSLYLEKKKMNEIGPFHHRNGSKENIKS